MRALMYPCCKCCGGELRVETSVFFVTSDEWMERANGISKVCRDTIGGVAEWQIPSVGIFFIYFCLFCLGWMMISIDDACKRLTEGGVGRKERNGTKRSL